jgi:acetolactate decarboxylase
MKKILQLLLINVGLLLGACATPPQNGVTQVATIDALLAGGYDGNVTLAELRKDGNIGLGTYNQLDGEMVLLDGIFYQIDAQGKVNEMPGDTLTPFAAVTQFEPNIFADIDQPVNLEGLGKMLDNLVPDQNRFVVIRIEGDFLRIRTRSVPAQTPPYRPLAEVIKEQTVFDFENVTGTLVGLRCPAYVKGLNVPGYHFHFLTQDRQAGGHVLSLYLGNGWIQIDSLHDWFKMRLPGENQALSQMDLSVDRSDELKAVEQGN